MLLDTHVWLSHASGNAKRTGPRTRREIDRAIGRGAVVISVVSMFELTALVVSDRLQFTTSAETWMRQSIDAGRMAIAELTATIATEAGSIPSVALPDPMDRLLVATARNLDVPIVTRDAQVLEYIRTSRIGRAIDAAR